MIVGYLQWKTTASKFYILLCTHHSTKGIAHSCMDALSHVGIFSLAFALEILMKIETYLTLISLNVSAQFKGSGAQAGVVVFCEELNFHIGGNCGFVPSVKKFLTRKSLCKGLLVVIRATKPLVV
uniref:Uncharacterized protein n=1 Tax=Sphaerodactylus townsendi TaxID=933632 RepID=A0ACB8G3I1_9SAUR